MSTTWIVPTVHGRADGLERSLRYPTDLELDVVVIHDEPTCGKAWVDGAREATGDYIYFAADDIAAHDGFLEAMVETVEAGFLPAAVVLWPNGSQQSCGGQGGDVCRGDCPDWAIVEWSPTPFIKREWWEHLEPHWEMLASLHYSSDCLVSAILATHGIRTAVRRPAVISHYNDPAGRLWTAGTDREAFERYRLQQLS